MNRLLFPLTLLGLALSVLPCRAEAPAQAGKSTGVALTIYNQNFALVRDRRQITFANGRSAVVIDDVAALIDPTSVHFASLTAPNAVSVREQNYRYDLINPTTLLNKSVGKRVTLRQSLGNGQVREIEGVIVTPVSVAVAQTGGDGGGTNTVYNGMVVRTDDGRLLLNPSGEIILHEMPSGLVVRPQLAWLVDSTKEGVHNTEVSYMTNGVTWKADYVAVLSDDDKLADITGWVTLDNKSGATYENASLQLIAGDVRRVEEAARFKRQLQPAGFAGAGRDAAPPQFGEESFFEYHLYTLNGTTTVRDNEQKQMTLLSASKAPTVKKFVYDGRRTFWDTYGVNYQPGEGFDTSFQTKVNVMMEIKNSKPNLGIALPKGKVRLYKADSRGALQFLGEDLIDHTPKDETLRLYIGDSFDIVGEHRRTNFKRISATEVEETFEVVLKNHRSEATSVSIIEHLWADWKITAKSGDFVKRDAHTVEFPVTVPKDGKTVVTYTVRTRWL